MLDMLHPNSKYYTTLLNICYEAYNTYYPHDSFYLTAQPQITYFKVVRKKYTNFSLEAQN